MIIRGAVRGFVRQLVETLRQQIGLLPDLLPLPRQSGALAGLLRPPRPVAAAALVHPLRCRTR